MHEISWFPTQKLSGAKGSVELTVSVSAPLAQDAVVVATTVMGPSTVFAVPDTVAPMAVGDEWAGVTAVHVKVVAVLVVAQPVSVQVFAPLVTVRVSGTLK